MEASTDSVSRGLEAELYEATVKFYETLNESYRTLDPTPVYELVTDRCGACKRYIESVDLTRRKGHRNADLGHYIIEDFEISEYSIGGDYQTVLFKLTHTGLRELDAKGREVRNVKRQTVDGMIEFVREDGRWLVDEQYLN